MCQDSEGASPCLNGIARNCNSPSISLASILMKYLASSASLHPLFDTFFQNLRHPHPSSRLHRASSIELCLHISHFHVCPFILALRDFTSMFRRIRSWPNARPLSFSGSSFVDVHSYTQLSQRLSRRFLSVVVVLCSCLCSYVPLPPFGSQVVMIALIPSCCLARLHVFVIVLATLVLYYCCASNRFGPLRIMPLTRTCVGQ